MYLYFKVPPFSLRLQESKRPLERRHKRKKKYSNQKSEMIPSKRGKNQTQSKKQNEKTDQRKKETGSAAADAKMEIRSRSCCQEEGQAGAQRAGSPGGKLQFSHSASRKHFGSDSSSDFGFLFLALMLAEETQKRSI